MSRFDPLSTAWQIHFRSVFDLTPNTSGQDPWATLVRTARGWIRDKERSPEITEAIGKRWFFEGGRHTGLIGQRRVAVETRRYVGCPSVPT